MMETLVRSNTSGRMRELVSRLSTRHRTSPDSMRLLHEDSSPRAPASNRHQPRPSDEA